MNALGTLSSDGWVIDGGIILNRLFAYFHIMDPSQTVLYKNNIASYSELVKKYGNEPDELANNIESSFGDMVRKYFDNVNLTVNHDHDSMATTYGIFIQCTVTDENGTYDLSKTIEIDGNTVTSIMDDMEGTL